MILKFFSHSLAFLNLLIKNLWIIITSLGQLIILVLLFVAEVVKLLMYLFTLASCKYYLLCHFKSKMALEHRATIVLNNFVHFSVINDQKNIEVTKLRKFNHLIDKCRLSLTLDVDPFLLVINNLLSLLFAISLHYVVDN